VQAYDCPEEAHPKAVPDGVSALAENEAWVSVGLSHATGALAVETMRTWCKDMGRPLYPEASSFLIIADGGGSHGSRLRRWTAELQPLANQWQRPITVCHLPPGTRKWHKSEPRLFALSTQHWRGKPRVTHQVMVELIAAKAGLRVQCRLDERTYAKGRRVSDTQMAAVNLVPEAFHGEWNYTMHPTTP
jgi:DDE family transposase